MSNFPISYILTWLPLFLRPSVRVRGPLERNPLHGVLSAGGPSKTVTLLFFGDIANVTGRPIATPPSGMLELFRRADLVIGNCETPLVNGFSPNIGQRLGLVHGSEARFLDAFLAAFQLATDKLYLSVANNHALDCGSAGLTETIANLEARGITILGRREAGRAPLAVAECGGLRIGLAAWTRWLNRSIAAAREAIWFEPDLEGIDWQGIKRSQELDTLCVVPHWDFEFRHFPQAETRAQAAQLARDGVDLIVGQHPHVIQPIERHGRGVCAYSLGDLVTATFRWRSWPTDIFGLLEVELLSSGPDRGSVCRYRLHPWVRTVRGGREEYRAVSELEGSLRDKVGARLRALFPVN